MNGDILFRQEDFVFSYRVAGVLIRDGRILLQKPVDDDHALIGGHVAFMETTRETLVREFREEIHADIEVGGLMAVGEIMFRWNGRACHQISLYYRISLKDDIQIPLDGSFKGYHEDGSVRPEIDFVWLPLEELDRHTVYPVELIPHILSGDQGVFHFVSNSLED